MSEPRQEPDQPTPIPPQPEVPEEPEEPDQEEEKEEARHPGYTLRKIRQTSGWHKKKGYNTQALWVIRHDGKWVDAHLSKQYAKQRLEQLISRG